MTHYVGHPAGPRLLALAESFPTLRGVLEIWDPERLDRWACGPEPGSGALLAAQFVLGVWNHRAEWQCGPFDFFRAYNCWDDDHLAAFLAWAKDPWYP